MQMKSAPIQGYAGIKYGLIGGICLALISLIGMVEAFNHREIISEIISMGQTLLLFTSVFVAYLAAARVRQKGIGQSLLAGICAGLIMTSFLVVLVFLGKSIDMRQVFINASPALFQVLLFQQESFTAGIGFLLLCGAGVGLFAGLLSHLPFNTRHALITGFSTLAVVGMLQDMISPILADWELLAELSELLFSGNGLSVSGALVLFVLVVAFSAVWRSQSPALRSRIAALPPGRQRNVRLTAILAGVFLLLILPNIVGLFLSEVLSIVGLYVLLGLGLNIVVGFAGLLDLGYVAFFAIGSYTVAILTSPEMGFYSWNFWQALPVAVLLGTTAGVLLGIPVLKMRGDYLAITTLGFGEIIRIMVLSDFLRPWLGGAQGIAQVPKANLAGFEFGGPQEIYYLILAGCVLVGFISWRLRDSRMGRAWMAVREDEDVAQAMGINLVSTKLLAFATGAGFSALSGAIFATKLSSVYPHSFNVIVSINILCVIIVGGMGSMPGVAVGALALVGLPEILREFAEYRLLVYGAVLVAMMLLKPEGLWPEATRQRELHETDSTVPSPNLAEGSADPRA
jgi:branched-chain amino acid transport system permease protein